MIDTETLKTFWGLLDDLGSNEVYVLLLIGVRNKRKIIDTVMIKSNNFNEFYSKVSFLLTKAKRFPFETELLIDINKKDVVKGFLNAKVELERKIKTGKDIRNLFATILKNIRYAQVTNYTMIKANEFLEEVNAKYVIKYKDIYYHVIQGDCERCIKKPEIPVPGIIINGQKVELYYVNV